MYARIVTAFCGNVANLDSLRIPARYRSHSFYIENVRRTEFRFIDKQGVPIADKVIIL